MGADNRGAAADRRWHVDCAHQDMSDVSYTGSRRDTAARCHVNKGASEYAETYGTWFFQPMKVAEKWSHMFWLCCREYQPSSSIQHWLESIKEWCRDPSQQWALCCNSRLCWRRVHEVASASAKRSVTRNDIVQLLSPTIQHQMRCTDHTSHYHPFVRHKTMTTTKWLIF